MISIFVYYCCISSHAPFVRNCSEHAACAQQMRRQVTSLRCENYDHNLKDNNFPKITKFEQSTWEKHQLNNPISRKGKSTLNKNGQQIVFAC